MKKLRLSFRELNWSKAVELVRGRALLLLTLMLLFPKGKGGRIDKEKESGSEEWEGREMVSISVWAFLIFKACNQ